jgi:hypothetical protein
MKNTFRAALTFTFVISSAAFAAAQNFPSRQVHPPPRVIIVVPRPIYNPQRVIIVAPQPQAPRALQAGTPRPDIAQLLKDRHRILDRVRMNQLHRQTDSVIENLQRENNLLRRQQRSIWSPALSTWRPPLELPQLPRGSAELPRVSPELSFESSDITPSNLTGFYNTPIGALAPAAPANTATPDDDAVSSLMVVGTQGDYVILSDGQGNYYRVRQKAVGKTRKGGR